MTPTTEFALKVTATLIVAAISWIIMMKIQKRKEKEADEKYEFQLKMIEMRNRKIGDNNES